MTDDGSAPPTPRPRRGGKNERRRPTAGGRGTETAKRGGARQPVGGQRHQGRVLALQILFEIDLTGHTPREAIANSLADQPAPPPVRSHVERLVGGVVAHRDEIDPYIAAAAPAFAITHLATVDRNVLRLAVYELLREPEVPPRAAINEAVELAKRFGGESSGRFVNGVLGTIADRVPKPEAKAAAKTRDRSAAKGARRAPSVPTEASAATVADAKRPKGETDGGDPAVAGAETAGAIVPMSETGVPTESGTEPSAEGVGGDAERG